MKRYLFFFLILFLIKTGYSQESIYLLLDENDKHFNQVSNKESGENYIDSVFSFKIRKKLNEKHKNLEEEVKYSFKWSDNNLSFIHNKYNDTINKNSKWLKEEFIVDFEYFFGYKWIRSKDFDKLPINSLYQLMKEKIFELHEESSTDYKRLNSPISKIYELENLYYHKYKFYKYHVVKGPLNKKGIDVISLKKHKCFDKYVKLRKRLLKANKIYIVKKEKGKTHLYEVALLKKINK